eukprot:COSAG06_NODE_37900_length_429_cov_11.951515_1_plen_35_part_10
MRQTDGRMVERAGRRVASAMLSIWLALPIGTVWSG